MSDWQHRKDIGDQHERRVMDELQRRGWFVHACGQGTYPPAIQRALSRTDSALRQFPDILAALESTVVAIDAKTRMPSSTSSRYAVSRRGINAGLQFQGLNPQIALYYVFGDMTVLTPAEVACYAGETRSFTSGAYFLIRTGRAHRFDDVFGRAVEQRSTFKTAS